MIAVIGGSLLACGTLTALAVAGEPMAVVACASLGILGLSAACTGLRGRLRRLPPPRQWRLRAAALRGEKRAVRSSWTPEELRALGDDGALRNLLKKSAPGERREGRWR